MVIGNVGDSRAYLIRNGTCAQVTLDHSLVEEQVREGLMTPEQAAHSDLQSVITRAIGIGESVEPDFFAVELMPEDLLLLATDGLTRYAQRDDIARIASSGADLLAICHELIDYAKQKGGADNITCMMLNATEIPSSGVADEVQEPTPAIEL
jgi:protein phosphatase